MSVFKILIGIVVVVVLLYFVMTLFVLPKSDILTPIANSTELALLKAGEPVCGIVNLPKDFTLTNTQLQNNSVIKDINLFLGFASFNSNPKVYYTSKVYATVESGIVLKTDSAIAQENYCVTCYPEIIFYDVPQNVFQSKDYFCQVSFGKKLQPVSAELPILQSSLQQGDFKLQNPFYKSSLNPEEYDYYFFIIPTQSKTNFNLSDLAGLALGDDVEIEHMKKFSSTEISEKDLLNMSLPNTGSKLIVQGIVGKNKNPFSSAMLPALFSVSSVEVLPNKEYQSKECITTTSEKQYKNFEKNLCVVYNSCNNCSLPTYCAEAWQKKGIDAESKTKNYAVSYLPIDDCS